MRTNYSLIPVRLILAALFALAVTTIPSRLAMAQTPEPQKPASEVQQLKERVTQLEQTVDELKTLLKTAASAASKSDSATGEKVAATADKVAIAETSTATVPAATTKAAAQDPKGESTFTIYGFAMLDMGYQFKQNHPDWFDVIRVTKLPSFKDEFAPNGKTYFGVRQSRLGVKSSTPTKYGELKTQFEFELFGTGVDAGQTTFRLRHAYGELGQFGAGQNWSPFMDIDVFPNSVEYWGPNGHGLLPQRAISLDAAQGKNAVTIALERPGASADQGRFADRIELAGHQTKIRFA